jgi:hypothetical protein
MNAFRCPVCGAEMKISKPARATPAQWIRFRCTCGHAEDRKDDGTEVSMTHSLRAVEGFEEFPPKGK